MLQQEDMNEKSLLENIHWMEENKEELINNMEKSKMKDSNKLIIDIIHEYELKK